MCIRDRLLSADPAIEITKTAGDAADGDLFILDAEGNVTFTYVVENTGGTDLANITITDDAGTPADPGDDVVLTSADCAGLAGPIAPDATVTCTLVLNLENADSPHTNNAGTEGTPVDENGNPYPGVENPTDDDDADLIIPPSLDLTKISGSVDDGADNVVNADGPVTLSLIHI